MELISAFSLIDMVDLKQHKQILLRIDSEHSNIRSQVREHPMAVLDATVRRGKLIEIELPSRNGIRSWDPYTTNIHSTGVYTRKATLANV